MTATEEYRIHKNSKSVVAGITLIFGIGCLYSLAVWVLPGVYNFLAVTRPVQADVMVVESWLYDYMLDAAAKEINSGGYTQVLTTGFEKEVSESSGYEGLSSAENCRARLIARGIDPAMIHSVPAPPSTKHHTYHMALAIKAWVDDHHIGAVNVYTGGSHARKSLILFQKALGKGVYVGVISCRIRHFDADRWWTSKLGIKVMALHFAGYIYARVWRF